VGLTLPQVAKVSPVAEVSRILATEPQFIVTREPPPGPDVGNPAVYAVLDATLAAHYTRVQNWPGAALYRLDAK
jgi:hypothetical protein